MSRDVFPEGMRTVVHVSYACGREHVSPKSLGLDYVDLYLMHWPAAMNPNGPDPGFPQNPDGITDIQQGRSYIETHLDMEKLLHTGKVKAVGVANCSVKFLEDLLPRASVVPAVNQIENHPQLPQYDVEDFCASKGIHLTAYSPLGSSGGPLMSLPTVQNIAAKHGVSAASVPLSYHSTRAWAFRFRKINSSISDRGEPPIRSA
ncbi:hypothetical protein B0A49_12619 [Cryomyces minteri]|uniref:NADP-dependent oxidoreductase domain-containing protein n=1 Tax=Cryomyces minteri TaxID=331657 RepID=A0A4U0UZ12_9PEZI|nr:hypothetical protein B0A49_12619 [Cryomyces minteri]